MGMVRLYRGIQGAGKSTLAARWIVEQEAKGLKCLYFSADLYWIDGITGEYKFDVKLLQEAHNWCFRGFLNDCQAKIANVLVVDNTNIDRAELSPYIYAASAYGWEHEIVTVDCCPSVAGNRNVHGVPYARVFGKYQQLLKEELFPRWNQTMIPAG